jgi:hypothetical protein
MLRPLKSVAGLLRSRWWAFGFALAAGAWVLHIAALAVAPLSLVQAMIAGGLVLLALPAERWFGHELGRREWIGLMLAAGGLAFLAMTIPAGGAHAAYSTSAMIAFEAGAVCLGICMLVSGGSPSAGRAGGTLLGAAAGVLLGVADVGLKALAGTVPGDPLSIISPWAGVALLGGIGAFFAMARALQATGSISVIALSTVTANCAAIAGGVVVFGDPIGSDPLAIVARSLAFVAVIAAAALMPSRLHPVPARA